MNPRRRAPPAPSRGSVRAAGPRRKSDDGGVGVQEKPATRQKLQRPRLYQVLLHNDDYTPMWFVVQILIHVFARSEADAQSVMLHAHTHGYAVAGVYTFEIAETKVAETMKHASEAQFPLLCSMEPEEGEGGEP